MCVIINILYYWDILNDEEIRANVSNQINNFILKILKLFLAG